MTSGPPQGGHDTCGTPGRQSGKPCRLPAGWGTSHPGQGRCRKHLGNSPAHIASVAEAQAREACERYGVPVRTTARQALTDELARSNGVVQFLLAKVQQLPEDELTWGTAERRVRTNPGQGALRDQPQIEVTQSGRPHVLVSMLERERRHLANVAIEMSRIGIEERTARVTESQVTLLNRVMDAVLADAGLSPLQQAKVAESFPRRLREVTAS